MATRFGVLVALALALLPASARGHGGLILMGSGSATVDGVLGPAEWSTAGVVDFPAMLPGHDGGGTVPARLYVMNDAANLYLAVRVQRATLGLMTQAFFVFDRDHDGANENGDDQVSVTAGQFMPTQFQDGYRWICPGAVGPTPAFCGAAEDTLRVEGSPPPGTIDGGGAVSAGGGFTTIELSHPPTAWTLHTTSASLPAGSSASGITSRSGPARRRARATPAPRARRRFSARWQ